jgi:anti-anti-sigma factor
VGAVVSVLWPGMVNVALARELDTATGPSLGMRLLMVLDHYRPAVLDVDLAAVTFLDCAGIGILVSIRTAAAQTACHVRITRPTAAVARTLHLAAVDLLLADPITELAPIGSRVSEPGRHRQPVPAQLAAKETAA